MSNPTTPFSWQMPTATDLVTDLPADFEVFGQAVATSMADLLGGTTGQILSKTSNTDMDFTWIANDQGDITGVTASSPLTGGGTSGAITVGILDGTTSNKGAVQLSTSTSSTSTSLAATASAVKSAYDLADAAIAKSTVTTAGDVIYATGSGAVTRLGIGTAGQVLKVNSGATAPEWGAASAASALTLVRSQAFTTSSSVDLSDIFSTTYDNYLILGSYTPSAGADLNFRFRVAGADNSTSNYSHQNLIVDNTTVTAGRAASGTSGVFGTGSASVRTSFATTMFNPFLTETKNYVTHTAVRPSGTIFTVNTSGGFNASTSFTGMTLLPSSGTVTGTIRIYGIANS
jgi:hypothetical protein